MKPAQIIDYVQKWWHGRETRDRMTYYTASIHCYNDKDFEVVVKTPWNTYHTAIRVVWGDAWNFTGWLSINGLDRRRLHNMMLTQRKVLETSTSLWEET